MKGDNSWRCCGRCLVPDHRREMFLVSVQNLGVVCYGCASIREWLSMPASFSCRDLVWDLCFARWSWTSKVFLSIGDYLSITKRKNVELWHVRIQLSGSTSVASSPLSSPPLYPHPTTVTNLKWKHFFLSNATKVAIYPLQCRGATVSSFSYLVVHSGSGE